jgi:hypothetical protein
VRSHEPREPKSLLRRLKMNSDLLSTGQAATEPVIVKISVYEPTKAVFVACKVSRVTIAKSMLATGACGLYASSI